ncbi:MAG TPA: PTS sugar transporter subunit IIA [Polyangia bacterium]
MTTSAAPPHRPIVGFVIVTHGKAAPALLDAVAAMLGPLPAAEAVSISMDERYEGIRERVGQACENVDNGAGVVLLVDLQGSSPYQACMSMLDGRRPAEVVCGVNLPMLMKLGSLDRAGLSPLELASLARDVGRRSIRLGSEAAAKTTSEEALR